jgi:uncharacterized protein (DUF1800 family)
MLICEDCEVELNRVEIRDHDCKEGFRLLVKRLRTELDDYKTHLMHFCESFSCCNHKYRERVTLAMKENLVMSVRKNKVIAQAKQVQIRIYFIFDLTD